MRRQAFAHFLTVVLGMSIVYFGFEVFRIVVVVSMHRFNFDCSVCSLTLDLVVFRNQLDMNRSFFQILMADSIR